MCRKRSTGAAAVASLLLTPASLGEAIELWQLYPSLPLPSSAAGRRWGIYNLQENNLKLEVFSFSIQLEEMCCSSRTNLDVDLSHKFRTVSFPFCSYVTSPAISEALLLSISVMWFFLNRNSLDSCQPLHKCSIQGYNQDIFLQSVV